MLEDPEYIDWYFNNIEGYTSNNFNFFSWYNVGEVLKINSVNDINEYLADLFSKANTTKKEQNEVYEIAIAFNDLGSNDEDIRKTMKHMVEKAKPTIYRYQFDLSSIAAVVNYFDKYPTDMVMVKNLPVLEQLFNYRDWVLTLPDHISMERYGSTYHVLYQLLLCYYSGDPFPKFLTTDTNIRIFTNDCDIECPTDMKECLKIKWGNLMKNQLLVLRKIIEEEKYASIKDVILGKIYTMFSVEI